MSAPAQGPSAYELATLALRIHAADLGHRDLHFQWRGSEAAYLRDAADLWRAAADLIAQAEAARAAEQAAHAGA